MIIRHLKCKGRPSWNDVTCSLPNEANTSFFPRNTASLLLPRSTKDPLTRITQLSTLVGWLPYLPTVRRWTQFLEVLLSTFPFKMKIWQHFLCRVTLKVTSLSKFYHKIELKENTVLGDGNFISARKSDVKYNFFISGRYCPRLSQG